MVVNSHSIEFGYELLSAVPYAYELHKRGELTGTVSGKGSAPLYYFSPKHTENSTPRSWYNTDQARRNGVPYTFIHRPERPNLQFPPYKEVYKNTEYKWGKPTLVIANRYNVEWDTRPINFFDTEILEWLFANLKTDYEIVYIAVDLPEHLEDNAHSIILKDRSVCKKHGVKVFQDIKSDCWNTSLMKVFANCEHYISMNGGYSVLASFFGGTNIIYSRSDCTPHTREIDNNSFWRWYPNHSNQRVLHVNNYDELRNKVKSIYIDKLPCANIIVRTSKRPKAFATCYNSIEAQDYPNINIVVTTDESDGIKYSREAKARHLHMGNVSIKEKPLGDEYGAVFLQNEYLDIAQRVVNGYIFILDDDDMFCSKNAVSIVMANAKKDCLTVWKVDFSDRIIPNASFGKEIKLFDIASNGFCYHTDHINKTDWSQWKRADYRTAKKLSLYLPIIWIHCVLTKLQGKAGYGQRIDINPIKNKYMKTVRILDPEIDKNCQTQNIFKRFDNHFAKMLVERGQAEYVNTVVDRMQNATPSGKPVVTENKVMPAPPENKVIEPVIEKKNVQPKGSNRSGSSRTRKPRENKKVFKA